MMLNKQLLKCIFKRINTHNFITATIRIDRVNLIQSCVYILRTRVLINIQFLGVAGRFQHRCSFLFFFCFWFFVVYNNAAAGRKPFSFVPFVASEREGKKTNPFAKTTVAHTFSRHLERGGGPIFLEANVLNIP